MEAIKNALIESAYQSTAADEFNYITTTQDRLNNDLFLFGDNVTQTSDFERISFNDLLAMSDKPSVGAKMQANWFTPYIAKSKLKEDALNGQFNALLLDHDTDNQEIWSVSAEYTEFHNLIFSSSFHLQVDEKHPEPLHRWKVTIPFSRTISADEFIPLAVGAQLITGTDPAQVKINQVCFVPNKLSENAPYETEYNSDAPLLDPLDASIPFVAKALEAYERHEEENKAKAQSAPLKPRTVRAEGDEGIIDKVNNSFTMSEVLESFGYSRIGKKFLAPSSDSGLAGVVILRGDDGRERAYSHHISDPLADGHAHDIFSVITVLQYGGDVSKAVASLAKDIDPEGQKQRQQEHERQKAEAAALELLSAQAEEVEQNGWPELVSLDIQEPDPLPIHLWPESMRNYVQDVAAETETSEDLAASLILSAYATAVQRIAEVEVKHNYSEPLCLYTAAGLQPAERKSSVFKRISRPFVRWEADKVERMLPEIKEAESLASTHKARMQNLRLKAAKAKDPEEAKQLAKDLAKEELEAPEIPIIPRVFTSDVTTEALAVLMALNGETGALMSAEGGIFETMAGRYSNSVPNIDLYLNAHAGDSVRIDRSGKMPIILDDPRLSVALAVQPDVIQSLSTKPGFQGRGLLGRFLYVLPASQLGKRTGLSERICPFSETDYLEQIKALLDESYSMKVKNQPMGTLNLSEEAYKVWYSYSQEVEKELGHDGVFEHCKDWGGKLAGAVARIAGIFHFARHGVQGKWSKVCADDMRAAAATGRALSTHALVVYGLMGSDPDIEAAKRVVRWIKRHNKQDFTARDVHQAHKSLFHKAAEIEKPLSVLTERGYIAPMLNTEQGKGRPSTRFKVNPVVFG